MDEKFSNSKQEKRKIDFKIYYKKVDVIEMPKATKRKIC